MVLYSVQRSHRTAYPLWYLILPCAVLAIFFLVPAFAAFYFSLTRWDLVNSEFIGLDNFFRFFSEAGLVNSIGHTVLFTIVSTAVKLVVGFGIALLLHTAIAFRSAIRALVFFPVIASTIGIGITFSVLLDPNTGLVNQALEALGVAAPYWLGDPSLALLTVAAVDGWKGVGLAAVILLAGLVSIPRETIEAARVDGASSLQLIRSVYLPLIQPAALTVMLLSVIGCIRAFDLIWTMTGGGPGFASDVLASVVYKQYQAGFYGLSTAGNVVLFLVVLIASIPIWLVIRRADREREG